MPCFYGIVSNRFRSKHPSGFYDALKGHTGIDVMMEIGTPIKAPCSAKVASIKKQAEMGNVLYLVDSGGNVSVYAHLSEILVKVGDQVERDQVVAKSGNTGGKTTAPHLHFEVISKTAQDGFGYMTRKLGEFQGYNIDPVQYLEKVRATKIPEWGIDAWEDAVRRGIIGADADPMEVIADGKLEDIFIKAGLLTVREGNVTLLRFIVALGKL